MSQLEYLIALVSIIVALALADLAGSFRELVRPRRTVRWHWLPLTWAAIVLMLLVQFWWISFAALQEAVFGRALAFLPYLLAVLVLYLACAFALPDPNCRPECAPERQPSRNPSNQDGAAVPAGPLNMKAFYFSPTHRQWFFGALILLIVIGQVLSIVSSLVVGSSTVPGAALTAAVNSAGAVLLTALIMTDRWWVHTLVTSLMLVATTYTFVAGLPSIG